MNNWRGRIDPVLKAYLERVIYEASKHKNAYKLSSKPDNAQLWVAVANLSRQINHLNSKLNYLEGLMIDITKKKSEVKEKKIVKTSSKKNKKLEKSLKKY